MTAANSLNISEVGFQSFNGVNLFKGRTLTAGTGITIIDGTGVSGNPTISITGGAAVNSVVTTNATPQFVLSGGVETINFALSNLVLGSSLPSLTTAANNVGVGSNVIGTATSASRNVGVGTLCLQAINTGTDNACVGYQSGKALTSAIQNTLIGTSAGLGLTTGASNCAVGFQSLIQYTTGTANAGSNNAFGLNSLGGLLTGTNNIAIGANSGISYASSESSNIAIGASGTAAESNVIRIGTQGSSTGQQNKAFLAGLVGTTVAGKLANVASTGQLGEITGGASGTLLQSTGATTSPGYTTATYPATAGTSGNVLTSDGTNWASTAPAAPAFNGFLAYLSGNVTNVTGDNTTYTVAFNSTSYNHNTDFNTATFTYTAPTTGKYKFGGVIYGFGYLVGHTQQTINLVTTATTFAMYTVNPFTMAGNGTLVLPFSQECLMTAGNTAIIQVNVNNSTKVIGLGGLLGLSSFWGQFLG